MQLTKYRMLKNDVFERLEIAEVHQIGRVDCLVAPLLLLLVGHVLGFVVVEIHHGGQDPGHHFVVRHLDAVSPEKLDGRFAGRVPAGVRVVVDHADEHGFGFPASCGHQQPWNNLEANLTSLKMTDSIENCCCCFSRFVNIQN